MASSRLVGDPTPLLRAEFEVPLDGCGQPVRVELWSSASGCAPTSQDAWVVAPNADRLRIAALDGITPTATTPRVEGMDGAAWAARSTAALLELPIDADTALRRAARHLLERPGSSSLRHRDRPHTMAAVADLEPGADGVELQLTLAGDCQMFVEDHRGWRESCGGGIVADAAVEAWLEWIEANPGADPVDDIIEPYERIQSVPAAWRTSPIGLFADPVLVGEQVPGGTWRRVVVASDGAQLDVTRCGDLPGWLEGLRDHERRTAPDAYKTHDDVVVLRATLPS